MITERRTTLTSLSAEVGTASIVLPGKDRYYESVLWIMKTIDDFESDVVELYDELQSTVERVEDRREVTHAELMCVLAGMLCTTAKESGISSEELMWTMKMNYQKSKIKYLH